MKRRLIDSEEILNELKNDPKFRKAQEALEPQYQLEREIISARVKGGLNQRELAKKINSTQAVISRIESGTVSPSINTVNKIAKAFGKKLQIKFVS